MAPIESNGESAGSCSSTLSRMEEPAAAGRLELGAGDRAVVQLARPREQELVRAVERVVKEDPLAQPAQCSVWEQVVDSQRSVGHR
jgi:hypothetical protein